MLTPWEIAKLLLIDDIWAGKLLPTMKPTSDVYSMQMEYSLVTYTKFRMDLIKLQNNVAKQMVLLRTVQHFPITGMHIPLHTNIFQVTKSGNRLTGNDHFSDVRNNVRNDLYVSKTIIVHISS
jgi:hypothetical protein